MTFVNKRTNATQLNLLRVEDVLAIDISAVRQRKTKQELLDDKPGTFILAMYTGSGDNVRWFSVPASQENSHALTRMHINRLKIREDSRAERDTLKRGYKQPQAV